MLTSKEILPDSQSQAHDHQWIQRIGNIHATQPMLDASVVLFFGERENVAMKFLNEDTIRFKVFSENKVNWETTPALLPLQDRANFIECKEEGDQIVITTKTLRVKVSLKPFHFEILDQENVKFFEQQQLVWRENGSVTCLISKTSNSHFYGLGEKTSFLDKNGECYENWNSDVYSPHVPDTEALYQSIPYMIHFEYGKPAYGLLLDNPGKSVFDMRSHQESYQFSIETGELDFYIIYGPSLKEVIGNYTDLVGKMPLPPRWSIGYQQSRYSYLSQEEVLEVAKTFREKEIPCDVIYLDIHYMDQYKVFTWDPLRFPNPKKMLDELKKLGFHIVPIVDPGVKKDPSYSVYREGIKNGYFSRKLEGDLFIGEVWPGLSAFPDFTDNDVQQWWGSLHHWYVKQGIRGIWNDMNEPSVFNTASKTMDADVVHSNNNNPKTHEEWHNLYGMLMSKATYEGLKKEMNGERPFVLTRAGYTGIHRYAAVWTGDNRSYWEHMEMSVPMVLNLGLSGVAFTGPDVGGFSHHTSGELLARWTQMGALFPFFRNHSAIDTIRQEPWCFGETIEKICKKYIQLRYKWMPYIYNLFYEASMTGLPVVRPLILEYPDDQHVYNLCDQYLLGRDVLVAPVFRPGKFNRSVYLPEGNWVNYWTGEIYRGQQTILVEAPLETMPIFIKQGLILPEQALGQFAEDVKEDYLKLNIYAGEEGETSYQYYEDDGKSFNYETGAFTLGTFEWIEEKEVSVLRYVQKEGLLTNERIYEVWVNHCPYKNIIVDSKDASLIDKKVSEEAIKLSVKAKGSFEINFKEGGLNE